MTMNPVLVGRELTELDHARLRRLAGRDAAGALAGLLADADVVPGPEINGQVITMYTRFELEDAATGQRQRLAIVYPDDADPAAGLISVLSPLGLALIGLRDGAEVACPTPAGVRGARIRAVISQPEANGDYRT